MRDVRLSLCVLEDIPQDYKYFFRPGRTKLLNPHKHIKGYQKVKDYFEVTADEIRCQSLGPVQSITGLPYGCYTGVLLTLLGITATLVLRTSPFCVDVVKGV